MKFRLRGSKSIRGSSSSAQTKLCKKCPPFGLSVQADLHLRKIGKYLSTPQSSENTIPSSTDSAHPTDLRRPYLALGGLIKAVLADIFMLMNINKRYI